MKEAVLLLSGTRGSGKSTLARELCRRFKYFQIIQAVTTRAQRSDDVAGEYEMVSIDDFANLKGRRDLLTATDYMGDSYGIRRQRLADVLAAGRTAIAVVAPESVADALAAVRNFTHDPVVSVYLDASDEVLDQRLRKAARLDAQDAPQRTRDRTAIQQQRAYRIESGPRNMIEDVTDLIEALVSYVGVGGILPKRLVVGMMRCGMLIENGDEAKVEGASYDLRLDDEFYQDGKQQALTPQSPFIIVKPGDFVLVGSREVVNLPTDVTARFDLAVSLFFQGIILSNGPQIDPGFRGRLFCELFNASADEVQLKLDQHYATIEFAKLFEHTKPYGGRYNNVLDIGTYLPRAVKASAVSTLGLRVAKLESARWWERSLPNLIAIFSLVVALVALFFKPSCSSSESIEKRTRQEHPVGPQIPSSLPQESRPGSVPRDTGVSRDLDTTTSQQDDSVIDPTRLTGTGSPIGGVRH